MSAGGRMNCKPGDLAIVVSAFNPANLGRIIRVTSFAGKVKRWHGVDRWNFDDAKPLIGIYGNPTHTVRDRNLRPIRDTPGTDETLSWLDVPSLVEVYV